MKARNGELALMIVDLDRFKEINDVHGHAAGDELLKATAARITALLSHTEFAARLGGDEFVIVQTGRDQPASAARLADKLLEVFSKPVLLAGQPFHVGLTIGVAVYPRDGDDTRKLLANADLALYRAKEHGRARACFFTPDMDETVRERRILAQQLTQAIENDELEVYYQAQASIATGEIIGFEALARWNHPTHGYISPVAVHPDRRGDGPDPASRRMGPAKSLQGGRELDAALHGRRQPLADPVQARQPAGAHPRDPARRPACRRAGWSWRSPRAR